MAKSEKKVKKSQKKICFLITPIGFESSPIRKRVDQWMNMIYSPALGVEYEIVRADKISSPGIITDQIVQLIVDADLVIIDYTDLNPNVMYEAAIRHLTEKPYIQIHSIETNLPFDIHNLRSIPYDPCNLNYPNELIDEIKKNLKVITNSGFKHAQLVKEKFDFDKIFSDPEKFVSLLSEYLVPLKKNGILQGSINAGSKTNAIISVPEYYAGGVGGMSAKRIVCPNCKTIGYENFSASGWALNHYKCTVCGTEFV